MASDEGGVLLIVDDDAINRAAARPHLCAPLRTFSRPRDWPGGPASRSWHGPDRLCAVLLDVLMPGLGRAPGAGAPHAGQEGCPRTLPVFLITADARGFCDEGGLPAWASWMSSSKAGGPLYRAAPGPVGGRAVPGPAAAEPGGGIPAGAICWLRQNRSSAWTRA